MPNKKNNKGAHNYQDEAEVREYQKGKRAGKQSARGSKDRFRSRTKGSNNRYQGSGKKPRTGGKFRHDTDGPNGGIAPVVTGMAGANDGDWYALSDRILDDAANISYFRRVGVPLPREYQNAVATDERNIQRYRPQHQLTPGIMKFNFVPAFGDCKTHTDPLNVSANAIFTFMRSKNSRSSLSYEAADVAITILALDSLYMWYETAVRAYGLLTQYSALNAYTPESLITSMNFDFKSFMTEQTSLRQSLNTIAYKMQALPVPSKLPYNARHIQLCQNIYRDAEGEKAQYYYFMPAGYWLYRETNETGSRLNWVPFTKHPARDGLITVAALVDALETMLTMLLGSEDVVNIAADILKAYGDNALMEVHPIAENYITPTTYNPEISAQIENLTIVSSPEGTFSGSLRQESGDLMTGTYLVAEYDVRNRYTFNPVYGEIIGWDPIAYGQPTDVLINMHIDNPTPMQSMIATRLTAAPLYSRSAPTVVDQEVMKKTYEWKVDLFTVASEFILSAEVFTMQYNYAGVNELYRRSFQTTNPAYLAAANGEDGPAGLMAELAFQLDELNAIVSTFDWAPMYLNTYLIYETNEDNPNKRVYIFYNGQIHADLDNYVVIKYGDLMRMNAAAMLKMFAPPSVTEYMRV